MLDPTRRSTAFAEAEWASFAATWIRDGGRVGYSMRPIVLALLAALTARGVALAAALFASIGQHLH